MYGLAQGTDLSFFEGATLIQVCIGENEVVLNFHPSISVMIASNVVVLDIDGGSQTLEDSKAIGLAATSFLGNEIAEAVVKEAGTTALRWSGGEVLEIRDTWENFESYTITYDEIRIVV